MVQKTRGAVVMTSNAGSSRKKTKPYKGVAYKQLDPVDDPEDSETVIYERPKEDIHNVPNKSSRNHLHTDNVQSQRIQVFGSSSSTSESYTNYQYQTEMSELRSRKDATAKSWITDEQTNCNEYIERDIQEGDTLQNLALKYGCKVAELKRLNNLINDQEFYGLPRLKVPARKHGYLQELVEKENEENGKSRKVNGQVTSDLEANEEEGDSDCECPDLLVRTVSIRDAICSQSIAAQNFLQNMDKDIHGIVQSTRTRMNSLDEVKEYLTAKRIQPLKKQPKAFSGAEFCGIRWWNVLIVMLLIGLLVPLLYFLYLKFGQNHHSHPSSTPTSGNNG